MKGAGTIDAHAHVFRPAAISPRGVDHLAPADRDAPVEDLLEHMAGGGVDAAVLVPLDAHDDYVATVLAEFPKTFAAIAVATPAELQAGGTRGVESLRARRDHFGFHGLRTQWLGEPRQPMTDSPALPILRYLAEQGLLLWTYLPPDQLPLLPEVIRELPELRVVLNHLGFCPHDMQIDEHRRPHFDDPFPESTVQQVLRLSEADSVHLMFSGQYALSTQEPPYSDLFRVTRRFVEAYGLERLLWASDYPWTRDVPGYRAMLDLVPAVLPDLDAERLARVRGGTARTLFPHLAGEPTSDTKAPPP
ncbi:MAG TPA: amidohydrolase family protein [Rubrobacter sp.]|jgi:predicted TIM-barrel fold metal-dependent hydrolase|nr:amidohydrolase family protein [Rubrobacter sp.]